MKKGKEERDKAEIDVTDNSLLIGSMKGQITILGDIFSTGAWPRDQEIVARYDEQAADLKNETEVEK